MLQRYFIWVLPIFCLAFSQDRGIAQAGEVEKPACPFYYHKTLKKNVYTQVEIEAEYEGGSAAWQRYLNKHLKYPQEMIDNEDLQTSVSATCIVDTDGRIIGPKITNKSDTSDYSPLDKHFIQIIKSMPKWVPAICEGKKVASEKKIIISCIRLEIEEP
ncbi:energy transducer TonB [Paraflavitalea sp. CAU 1676]|uniref:energy transducer TonB n=1 Tax=Paraflavitalea sp. CAU 1676 TaxID=3032598 RepID=UPI0023DB72D1|nr:energy transducer TonB [Paraflavitalea sp. CAU 1676]MDF2192449.1 energy transducer TonB [Paraflavitalea sp. CAU 1676]